MSSEREQVQERVLDVVHHLDRKSWQALREQFAEEATVDYSSLLGGSAAPQSRDALVSGWETSLQNVVTQHLLGPIEVQLEGEHATARCHVRAFHYAAAAVSGREWEVLGHYHFQFIRTPKGYRVHTLTLETFHQLGNRELLRQAQAHR
jgi:SnoaL-like domain